MKGKFFKIISLSLVLSLSTFQIAFAKSFSDTGNHWASSYIEGLAEDGYVSGYEGNLFKPDNEISRAEFYSVINKMSELEKTYTVTFSDVLIDDWYYNEVAKAIKAGYLVPTTGNLNPNKSITRAEVVNIIGYLYKLKPNQQYAQKFSDLGQVNRDTLGYFGTLAKEGFVEGYADGSLRPNAPITRAEVCKILGSIIEVYGLPSPRVVVDSKIKFGDRNLYN